MAERIEGANYRLEIARVALLKVWKRPDLSLDEGARIAAETAKHLSRIASGACGDVRGIVLDMRIGPEIVGIKTRESIGRVILECERRGVRFALVPGSQVQTVLLDHALEGRLSAFVRRFDDIDEAIRWAGETSLVLGT